jgi:hypothetical protein
MAQIQKPAQTIKVLDGQVFICSPITANAKGEATCPQPYKFPVKRLVRAVTIRMEHCMGELLQAYAENGITQVITHDGVTEVHFAWGEAFHSGSYEALESLLKKLEANLTLEKGLDVLQLEELLTCREADQLFKAYIQAGYSWGSQTTMLDYLRESLKRKEQQ